MTAPARPVPDVAAAEAVAVLMTEVSEGRLTAAMMADRAVARCREMFGQCDGPTDVLWSVHLEICRAVLGHAGLPVNEVAQFLAVARNRENPGVAADYSTASVSFGLDAQSPGNGDADPKDDDLVDVPDDVLDEAEAAAMAVIDRYRQREARADDR
ncbi:MAG: hypothetical protein WBO08_06205 [Mycobacterium sp.]